MQRSVVCALTIFLCAASSAEESYCNCNGVSGEVCALRLQADVKALSVLTLDQTAPSSLIANYNNWIGKCLFLLDDTGGSVKHFDLALALDPGHVKALNNMCHALNKAGEVEYAMTYCSKAIEADPDYVDPRLTLGRLHFSKSEYNSALEQFQTAAKIEPKSDHHLTNVGVTLHEMKRFEEASTVMMQVIGLVREREAAASSAPAAAAAAAAAATAAAATAAAVTAAAATAAADAATDSRGSSSDSCAPLAPEVGLESIKLTAKANLTDKVLVHGYHRFYNLELWQIAKQAREQGRKVRRVPRALLDRHRAV
jgi:tetratricopeptide (TPR) repeat protein